MIRDSFWNSNRFCDRSYNYEIEETDEECITSPYFRRSSLGRRGAGGGSGSVMSRNGTLKCGRAKGRALLQPERGQEAGQVAIE